MFAVNAQKEDNMQIIGHKLIPFEPFKEVYSVKNVIRFENLAFKFDEVMIKTAIDTDKNFSVFVTNINEIVLANAFGAKYILLEKSNTALIKEAVRLAEFYLFDTKVAIIVDNLEKDLTNARNLDADVSILRTAILQISY